MAFFNSAVDVLQTLVIALGAGLGIWGVINLLEGYGQDNPASKSQGMKQLMAGGGVALIGLILAFTWDNVNFASREISVKAYVSRVKDPDTERKSRRKSFRTSSDTLT